MPQRTKNIADAVAWTQRQKAEKRPLRAGNWAAPMCARQKKDLYEWNRREIEQYLVTFGGSSLAEKARFISQASLVDTRQPLIEIVHEGKAVDEAVAAAASRRPDARAKHPKDCHFVIPSYGIRAKIRKVSAVQESQSAFERLNKLLEKQQKRS